MKNMKLYHLFTSSILYYNTGFFEKIVIIYHNLSLFIIFTAFSPAQIVLFCISKKIFQIVVDIGNT